MLMANIIQCFCCVKNQHQAQPFLCCLQGGAAKGGDVDVSDDDLFKVRDTASAERPAHDLEAENAMDTAVLSMADLHLDRWHADGAREALRDRFVTGESLPLDRISVTATALSSGQAAKVMHAAPEHCQSCFLPFWCKVGSHASFNQSDVMSAPQVTGKLQRSEQLQAQMRKLGVMMRYLATLKTSKRVRSRSFLRIIDHA